ncbi:transposase [Lactobacillus delbrueckii subsp. lactis DSM 20072]|nr:transposase [Lactobacillus delbrueckii subsp. lactis DSM 20072]MCT3500533.1 transposase [Lactobacillus delbrueckii subsp. lactis]
MPRSRLSCITMDHEKAPKHGISWQASADTFIVINILPKDKAIESDATLVANQGINYCSQMFSLERAWEDLSAEERYEKRQSELKPLLEKFSDWCSKKSISVLPSGKQGTAFKYCMKHMDKFMNVLKDSRLELSNNRAERAVKEIVMGRKNWLFSQSSTGAKSMAIIMSILETAKQNGLDQFKYINYLLDKLLNELSISVWKPIYHGLRMFSSTVSKSPIN